MQTINTSGRRKNAIARVYMTQGTGKVTINKRDITEYFPLPTLQYKVCLLYTSPSPRDS